MFRFTLFPIQQGSMKHAIILTMLKLLSATVWCEDFFREVVIINRLNDFFNFDHNIFFLDNLIDQRRYIPANRYNNSSFPPQTVYIFHHNRNKTQLPILVNSKNTFLIIVVADSFKFGNDTQLLDQVKAIRRLNVKIGVSFSGNDTSMNIVEQLFRWSWIDLSRNGLTCQELGFDKNWVDLSRIG